MPVVEFPDAEAMCVVFARTKTTAVVATKVPNSPTKYPPNGRPPRYVRVWRTGGGALNRVLERVQVTVTCGAAAGSVVAGQIARELRTAFLNDYTEMRLVRGVEEVTGPYFDPDPDTGEDRYSFTIEMMVRAAR